MDSLSNPLNLLATNMCSPMIIFIVYTVISGVSLFITYNNLKKYNTKKMDTLFNIHLIHEVKMLIIMGVVIYGLCQYNQVNLAWVFMLFPIVYIILKNIIIFIPVSSANQNTPEEIHRKVSSGDDMFKQIQGSMTDQQRVNNFQQEQQKLEQKPPPNLQVQRPSLTGSVNKNIGGLSPPLNSSITGMDPMDPMGNMAGF